MRNRLRSLIVCFIGSILIMVIIYWASNYDKIHPNGFMRKLPSHMVEFKNRFDIGSKTWYLSSALNGRLLFRNSIDLNRILSLDSVFRDSMYITMVWPDSTEVFNGSNVVIDSNRIYLVDGVSPNIYGGSLPNPQMIPLKRPPYFSIAIPVSPCSFIFRSLSDQEENYLCKVNFVSGEFKAGGGILENQHQAVFSTDGTFIKIPDTDLLIYTYYYRNQFICVDTNLTLIYRGKTVDTTTISKIQVASIPSDRQITMSAPPLFVNKETCANKNWLLIHSELRADNEMESSFNETSVIDVYSIKDGKYNFSFYLPDFKGNKVRDLKLFGNMLYALIGQYVYRFEIEF